MSIPMTELMSKREQARRQLTDDAIIHLHRTHGAVSAIDLMQIKEAVASTLMEKLFDDE